MYQLYYRFTDTKRTFPPLFNEFFFRRCLIPLIAICRGTFDTSGSVRDQTTTESDLRPIPGPIGRDLPRTGEAEGVSIVEGHLMPDHVHMCIAIPPKHPVASVIGFLKGKSAIAIARLGGKERNFSGEHFG